LRAEGTDENREVGIIMSDAHSNSPPLIFIIYFIVLIAFAIGSTLWIRRQPTPQLKKQCSNKISILGGVIFLIFILAFLWKQPVELLFAAPALVFIVWLQIRNTFYCDNCGKRSQPSNWFASTYHCPYCGHKLK
jgi:phosphatidylserine synthase